MVRLADLEIYNSSNVNVYFEIFSELVQNFFFFDYKVHSDI